MTPHANGHAADDFSTLEQTSGFLQRWGGPLGTVASVVFALFLLWHQIDLSLQMQQAQVAALQAQVGALQVQIQAQVGAMQQQIDRMEGRIYALTAASPRAADQR